MSNSPKTGNVKEPPRWLDQPENVKKSFAGFMDYVH